MKTETTEFKDSFIKIVKTIKLFDDAELTRITEACEAAGNYEGIINQSFGAMAKRLSQQYNDQFKKADIALPILTALIAIPDSDKVESIEKSFDLAQKFIDKMNEK